MDVQTGGAEAPNAGAVAPVTTTNNDGPISIREAAQSLARSREERSKQEERRAPNGQFTSTAPPPAQENSAPEAEAAPVEQASGEAEASDPAEQQPSIDPPRSWSKEDKDWFANLPRETQERIAERERLRDTDFSRRQTEATEAKKAAETAKTAADQQRQQYENALPQLLNTLTAQFFGDFADIKSYEDVRKMAEDDPFRYARFDAAQKQIQLVANEAQQAQQRQVKEREAHFKQWSEQQDAEFLKAAPEFADPKTAKSSREEVTSYLTKVIGIPGEQIGPLWEGKEQISLRDAKAQLLIRDAARWHAAQQKAKAAVAQQPPPVQRPGSAPAVSAADANIRALEQKFNKSGSAKDGAALLAAKRAARR